MRITAFCGSNRDFRRWLGVGASNVVSLALYRYKKITAQRERHVKVPNQL